ncbi:large conductance mechanosensitive channel protein MscL [Pengzhenrongella sp.]|jgi:large conductance mechanosensitive channel|uniref:large conductance mechanosensitive channel protein MscL n=1 Tax=Pengzhenrongella sp. TaxID=2888820 RepID=UPI002F92A082
MSVLTGFKDFIMRGNVMQLAVAVVIGTAFTALINGIVTGLFNPLIAAIFGQTDLTKVWAFRFHGADFLPGQALDALVKFLVIAATIYFVIVLPLNHLAKLRVNRGVEPEPEPEAVAEEILLLEQIRDLLSERSTLTGRSPATGAHAAIAPLDSLRAAPGALKLPLNKR